MFPWNLIPTQQPQKAFIAPLFWQHGESESVLREEIQQMQAKNIGGFIIESRPHPDFLGERWWRDLDVILDEARKHFMKLWIFDDSSYPSGFSAGRIKDAHPEFLKVYLAERHIDTIGPLSGSSFFINAWLESGESLVRVIAARRTDGVDQFDAGTLANLTARVSDGILYWDVPEGDWRIFILICTRNGGEDWTRDYLNPLVPEAVMTYIDFVYEAHYHHYAAEFGKTIAGFFSDEPRFGNAATYEATLGKFKMVLPYAPDLLHSLDQSWDGDFSLYLPCLWYDGGPLTAEVRYTYMDVVTRSFSVHFSQKIGNWCQAHGVQLIGHIVEDNGAHARLGYGPGHFYRAISGQHVSGLDIVYQVWPDFNAGRFTTPFGYLQADFFYWGITKLASSAGHIDPKKNGITVCEVFGAYGWQEGLKLMKWLTDHICVRGVNFIIPHAFSPKAKDPDCPPHFYARGLNPQWRYFQYWSKYANRLCNLLSGGTHVAPVAVLYHAEAEWSGEYEPFERVVKTLAIQQIDCDILPLDTLIDKEALNWGNSGFRVNGETYRALVIPFAERLPGPLLKTLVAMMEAGVPVFFMGSTPKAASRKFPGSEEYLECLNRNAQDWVCTHAELTKRIKDLEIFDIQVATAQPDLRYYHYRNQGYHLYFFTNESRSKPVRATITFQQNDLPVGYDAMYDKCYRLEFTKSEGSTSVNLELEPYESLFIIFIPSHKIDFAKFVEHPKYHVFKSTIELTGDWQVSVSAAGEYPRFQPIAGTHGLGNISQPGILPYFSGTIRYKLTFLISLEIAGADSIGLDLGAVYETAEVLLNGNQVGVRICPPYFFDIKKYLVEGDNLLQVDVTNTLAKQLGSQNVFDRSMAQEPSGLLGPVRLLFSLSGEIQQPGGFI